MSDEFNKFNNYWAWIMKYAKGIKEAKIMFFIIWKSWEQEFTYSQSQVSQILGISRRYVNQVFEKLVKHKELKKYPRSDARGRFSMYEISKNYKTSDVEALLVNSSSQVSEPQVTGNSSSQGSEPEITSMRTPVNTLKEDKRIINKEEIYKEEIDFEELKKNSLKKRKKRGRV